MRNKNSVKISDMSQKLDEVVRNTGTINHWVDDIAAVSEQTAAGIEQTAATVQQASSSMDEMYASTIHLAEMVEQLNESVRQFKLHNGGCAKIITLYNWLYDKSKSQSSLW